jgi:hypothetical protein
MTYAEELERAGDNLAHANMFGASPDGHKAWWKARRGGCHYCESAPVGIRDAVYHDIFPTAPNRYQALAHTAEEVLHGYNRIKQPVAACGCIAGRAHHSGCSDQNALQPEPRIAWPPASMNGKPYQHYWSCIHHPWAMQNFFNESACEHGCHLRGLTLAA